MILTNENYFIPEAMREYWSVSQFKAFRACEAAALAELNGEYQREETTALLVGSYVDAYFSREMAEFIERHPGIFKKNGELKAEYQQADRIIERIESDALFSEYLRGDLQAIRTGTLFGVPWKIKIDALHPDKIVDLKIVRDFEPIYQDGYGRRSWVEYWGYDIQGAIYQRIEQISAGRAAPLPFYLAAATKEREPNIEIFKIPQYVLDNALRIVEADIDRFDLIKTGEVEPIRCGTCDYCKRTKKLTEPVEFQPNY